MTELLLRLVVVVTVAVVVAVFHLLVGAVRLSLRLLAVAGFRGGRVAGLVATLVGVWWAARIVGVGPAAWLTVIGWTAWATRHHRTAIRQHAAVRKLTAALEQHTGALAAATNALQTRPTPAPATKRATATATAASVDGDGHADQPSPTAEQSPEQTVAALGRYAAAFIARHTPAADDATPTRRLWRHPR